MYLMPATNQYTSFKYSHTH